MFKILIKFLGRGIVMGEIDDKLKRQRRLRIWSLRIVAVCLCFMIIFDGTSWSNGSVVPKAMVWTGAVSIGLAIGGRVWTRAFLGHRKAWQVVADGPYSIVRHPLYMFSIIGTVGIGAQTESLVMMLAVVLPVSLILYWMTRIEEADLTLRFDETYRAYQARTPRLWPNPSLWVPSEVTSIDYKMVAWTFCESALMALVIPLFMLLRLAQAAHLIAVLYRTP